MCPTRVSAREDSVAQSRRKSSSGIPWLIQSRFRPPHPEIRPAAKIVFLTNSAPNFTWVTFNSFRSKAFTCSLCSAATRSQCQTVPSLTSMTLAIPRKDIPLTNSFNAMRTFSSMEQLKNIVPDRSQKEHRHCRHRSLRTVRPFRPGWLRSYVAFRPLFPILTTFSRVIEILSVNYYRLRPNN